MRHIKTIIITAVLLMGTSLAKPPEYYYEEFNRHYPHSTKIVIKKTNSKEIAKLIEKGGWRIQKGLAYQHGNDIYVDMDTWELLTPRCQRHIMYHELGHAVMGMVHSTNKRGFWNYIMYPDINLLGCYNMED